MTTDLPLVTDHAMIRYMERVMGLDLEPIRKEIEEHVALGVRLGATAVRHDGFRFVIAGGRVVTVMHCEAGKTFVPRALREAERG